MALVGRGLRGAAGLRGQDRLDLRDKRGGAGGLRWRGAGALGWGGAGPEDGAGRGGAARHAHYQPPGPAAATPVAQAKEQLQPRVLK